MSSNRWMAAVLVLGATVAMAVSETLPAERWQTLIEAEWTQEAQVLTDARAAKRLTTADDAAGGCDGVTNGRWGFHTAVENEPWWQVDLGAVAPLKDICLWNRADDETAAMRASRFRVLLSEDGQAWQKVYEHPGTVFYGYRMPDRWPLRVALTNAVGRYVRLQLPGVTALHLDEVEVHELSGRSPNIALKRPAEQSSLSEWSVAHARGGREPDWGALTREVVANCERQGKNGADRDEVVALNRRQAVALPDVSLRALYMEARYLQRRLALASPLLDFDTILFTKRVPGSYSHMSDQYYGWWSRPGGGLYLLKNFRSGAPVTEDLTGKLFQHPGSFLRPALSDDATKVLFAWCRHYPELAQEKDKLNKANVTEDAFYHVFEMNLDGTGLRQLTRGKYDDFDARYLPDGRIVFLSTRRGHAIQVGKASAAATVAKSDLPDCYVRCGGDASRPVAVYTLHTMDANGDDLTAISPFEMFEWEPSVANNGTILYSRWDYVDRDNMPYMSLWAINPDGTNARLVYGNYTQAPHCTFEPRSVPGSDKIIFTASGHHSQTMGSLVLLDPTRGMEGEAPLTRLTPETPFPEIEGWPQAYFANPWPLAEDTMLVSWGVEAETREGRQRPVNGMGIHLFTPSGGLELLYRDPDISSMYPIPVQARTSPPTLSSPVNWEGPQEGRFLIGNVTRGLSTVQPGDITALRVVAVPAKTQPWMNQPAIGLTRDDPGKAVLGTVPVEADGSAYFRVPSGVAVFFQAVDREGRVVQTMRSATHVQPGQTLSCVGCHDMRQGTPSAQVPLASLRAPSKITPGPEGSWPLRFDRLVQPVLEAQCVRCHRADGPDAEAAKYDLTAARAYDALADYGKPSLREQVLAAYRQGVSTEGRNPSQRSALLALFDAPGGHRGVALTRAERDRLMTWMDTYGQRAGAFDQKQEQELERLRDAWQDLLAASAVP